MRVNLVQLDIKWASPCDNRRNLDALLSNAPKADLVLLPEMFSTGFATSAEGIAENAPSQSLQWMKAKASEMDCAIAGSIATCENGKYYNRFHFVKPDGSVTSYDKHHLFTYSHEDKTYTAGSERTIVEWRGMRFLLIVCYDLRFPVWSRNRKDYDAILCVASWPVQRRFPWDTLLKARAIENQCFVAAANRCGDDPSCHYSGGTILLDPYGKTIEAAPDNVQSVVSAEMDMSLLEQFRAQFPVLEDADRFEII